MRVSLNGKWNTHVNSGLRYGSNCRGFEAASLFRLIAVNNSNLLLQLLH